MEGDGEGVEDRALGHVELLGRRVHVRGSRAGTYGTTLVDLEVAW